MVRFGLARRRGRVWSPVDLVRVEIVVIPVQSVKSVWPRVPARMPLRSRFARSRPLSPRKGTGLVSPHLCARSFAVIRSSGDHEGSPLRVCRFN